jgi:anthranilate phosphoribosyltransferase
LLIQLILGRWLTQLYNFLNLETLLLSNFKSWYLIFMSQFSWKEILGALVASQDLTFDQAYWAMNEMMSGTATDSQIAGLAVGLRVKGESVAEVSGMVKAMLANAIEVNLDRIAVDVVGTGGDGAHTVNISTMAAITVAGAGIPVLKHGNRAISSKAGTADVLEALGVAINMPTSLLSSCVADAGIAFCFAPAHHPAMKYAGAVRKELGIPTVFNVLGPLSNPGQPEASLLGCADLRLAPVLAQVQLERGFKSIVVRSLDGLDEFSTSAATQVWDVTSGELREETITPQSLGLLPATIAELRGGDAKFNAQVVLDILSGRSDGNYRAIRDVVALNAAATMVAYDAAKGAQRFGNVMDSVAARIQSALPTAYSSIDSGAASSQLEVWASVSQRFALGA